MGIDGAEIRNHKLRQKDQVQKLKNKAQRQLARSNPKTNKSSSYNFDISEPTKKSSSLKFNFLWITAFLCMLFIAAGPPLTLKSIADAAYNDDTATLNQKIDFDTLRQNLTDHMLARREVASEDNSQANIFSNFSDSLFSVFTEKLIDTLLNTDSIIAMIVTSGKDIPPSFIHYIRDIHYSLDTPVTIKASTKDDAETSLILKLSGFTWKLTDITIPETLDNIIINQMNATATEYIDPDPLMVSNKFPEEIRELCYKKWGLNIEKAEACIERNLDMREAELKSSFR